MTVVHRWLASTTEETWAELSISVSGFLIAQFYRSSEQFIPSFKLQAQPVPSFDWLVLVVLSSS